MNKRIVIIEDEFFVSNHLKKILESAGYEVVAQFHDGQKVLEEIKSFKNVIYLLDIQLSTDISGINIADELAKENIPFLFITANTETETFDEAILKIPVAYISKPFKEFDVLAGVSLAFQKIKSKIKVTGHYNDVFYVELDDILYLQSDNVYVNLYTVSQKFIIRKQLKELSEDLTISFKRCHRSYIVNSDKITKMSPSALFLDTIEIPLSRKYRENF